MADEETYMEYLNALSRALETLADIHGTTVENLVLHTTGMEGKYGN